jgi:two-component system, OmpR family, sensor kinase
VTVGRLSIRARLAAGFAAALLLVLAAAGAFVYLSVQDDLNSNLDDALRSRADDVGAIIGDPGETPQQLGGGPIARAEDKEGFSQIVTPGGRLVATTLAPGTGPALDQGEIDRAAREPLFAEHAVPGVEGEVRILGRPESSQGQTFVVIVGSSTDDRNETLAGLARAFLIGAPLAIVIASGLGYLLAGRSLAPVEAMRRRAQEITVDLSGERLPLPRAEDEIHHLGETLNLMLDRLEAGIQRERFFISDASHELRTPLAILAAELELADRPERSPEDLRAAVGSAREEIDRLSQLAEDLLVIARFDQGRLPIARQSVQLRSLLERVRDRFARRAKSAQREIVVEAPDDPPVDLDPFRVEQALGNLVDNALVHGGGDVSLSAKQEDGSVVLEVSDQGSGFDAGFEGQAFERFARGDGGRRSGGAGLGLAIVRAIAVSHGGGVSVVSAPGDSTTTVQVRLPIGYSDSSGSAGGV